MMLDSRIMLDVELKIAIIFIILTATGVFLINWWLKRLGKAATKSPFRQQLAEAEAEIASLSVEEARKRSLIALSDPGRFRAVRCDSPHRELPRFGPILLEFFRNFRSVSSTKGEFRISEECFRDSPAQAGTIKIGTDLDFCEYLAFPDNDEIIEAYAGENKKHQSLHHLILLEERLNKL
jgi:hypothetical protein